MVIIWKDKIHLDLFLLVQLLKERKASSHYGHSSL